MRDPILPLSPLPRRSAFHHPAVCIGIWVGMGLVRPMSGTLASHMLDDVLAAGYAPIVLALSFNWLVV